MDIVKRFAAGEEILFDKFNEYLEETNLVDKPINAWRKIIKNCKFNCWDCNFCDKVYEAKSAEKSHPLILAVAKEIVDSVNYDVEYNIPGLTSPRVQKLLYGLSKHCKKYLEIGSALGSTAAPIDDNCELYCVDNWSQNIQPASGEFELPNNTKEIFLKNIKRNVNLFDSDMLKVDVSSIKDIDLFFYDGPHYETETKEAVVHYSKTFAEYAILVFDDANWDPVVLGADAGIAAAGLTPIYSKKILNNLEDKSMWWNGVYILVVKRGSI
jgi:predicted O-methyltransferase YrrM